MTYEMVNECLACGHQELVEVLKLTDTPLTDAYKVDNIEAKGLTKYPLVCEICNHCGHVQLKHQVSPQESYSNYLYASKVTTGLSNAFTEYARSLSSKDSIRVLDIGSNDGSFIKACLEEGHKAYGIEPSDELARIANENNCPTIPDFFTEKVLDKVRAMFNGDKFDVITFNNVLANMSAPMKALELAKNLLKGESSKIYVQTGYHPVQFGKGLFDYIYHEHFSYFSVRSMNALAKRIGMAVQNVELIPIRGGSVRFQLVQQKSGTDLPFPIERFTSADEFRALDVLIESSRSYLKTEIDNYKNLGYKVFGYGASHSTGTLVHHFGLQDQLEWLVDENRLKHGLFMPGTSLVVKDVDSLFTTDSYKVVVVLAWQYFDQIYSKLRDCGYSGVILKPVIP